MRSPKNRLQDWLPLLAILGLALLLRFYPILSKPELEHDGAGGFGDTHLYHRLAYHLVTGHGYSGVNDARAYGNPEAPEPDYLPAVTRGPTYPFFLAMIYSTARLPQTMSEWAPVWQKVRLTQAFLDSTVCLLIFLILRDLDSCSPRPALCGAAIYALNPYSQYYSRHLLVESLMVFLMALSLFFVVRSLHSARPVGWSAAGGLCLALAGMGRAEYVLFGAVMVLIVAYCARPALKLRTAGSLLIAFGLALLPWTLRMNATLHRFSPMPTGATGFPLWLGTYETNDNWGGWSFTPPPEVGLSEQQRARLAEHIRQWDYLYQSGLAEAAEYDKLFMTLAKEQMKWRPISVVRCWFVRIPRLWYQEHIQMYSAPEPSGNLMLVYLSLGALGVLHYRGKGILPLLCLPVFVTALLLPLHIESRFSMTSLSAVIALAGLGLGVALEPRRPDPATEGDGSETTEPPQNG